MLVKNLPVLIFILANLNASAQTLSWQEAIRRATGQYPLTRQKVLVQQGALFTLDNLAKAYLPQVQVNGQASYQSAVTEVNVPVAGFKLEPPSKNQYKLAADISQLLYDGGVTRQQMKITELSRQVNEQQLEVELYQLRDRITQLYFGILLLDGQIDQATLVQSDLRTGIKTVSAQVQSGLVLRSNLSTLQAELLKAGQRIIELRSARQGLVSVLSELLNEPISDSIQWQLPDIPETHLPAVNRPELTLYDEQHHLIEAQQRLIRVRNLPKASAFVQGGYGRPGLNMLKNEFEPYYIAGVRLNWSLSGFYTAKNDRRLLDISQRSVDIQKDLFLLQLRTQQKQQLAEIEKWRQLIEPDEEILRLRTSIKEAAQAQLENRVITASDYLREVNEEAQARQTLLLHQLQWLKAKADLANINGNSIKTENQ